MLNQVSGNYGEPTNSYQYTTGKQIQGEDGSLIYADYIIEGLEFDANKDGNPEYTKEVNGLTQDLYRELFDEDSNGIKEKQVQYTTSGVKEKETFLNNETGQTEKVIEYDENGEPKIETRYFYDEEGNQTADIITQYKEDGSISILIRNSKYNYSDKREYDAEGLLTNRSITQFQGDVGIEVAREREYYENGRKMLIREDFDDKNRTITTTVVDVDALSTVSKTTRPML